MRFLGVAAVIATLVNHFWGLMQLINYQENLENLKKRQEELNERSQVSFEQPAQPVQMQFVYEPIDNNSVSSLASSPRITKIENNGGGDGLGGCGGCGNGGGNGQVGAGCGDAQ